MKNLDALKKMLRRRLESGADPERLKQEILYQWGCGISEFRQLEAFIDLVDLELSISQEKDPERKELLLRHLKLRRELNKLRRSSLLGKVVDAALVMVLGLTILLILFVIGINLMRLLQ